MTDDIGTSDLQGEGEVDTRPLWLQQAKPKRQRASTPPPVTEHPFLVDLGRRPRQTPAASPPPQGRVEATGYAAKAFDEEVRRVAEAVEGTRNDTLNVAAFNLGQLVGGGALDHTAVWQALNTAALHAGLDPGEVAATLRNGLEGGMASPRRVPELVRTDVPQPMVLLSLDAAGGLNQEPGARSWRPLDLGKVLDGTWTRPEPTVGRRSDGTGLFYPSRCHTVVAETEGGKTWFALSACLDELNAGNHVIYLDFEDDEGGIVGRLLTLGAHRDRIRHQFHYLRPEGPLGTGIHLDDLRQVLTEHTPTLGVLDGITEAMVMHGLNPLDNNDAAKFGRLLPSRIAADGPAVVSLDHVVKDRDGRGRYALGAVHKLNGLNGAQYLLENRSPFGIGVTGRSTVKIAKDRPGHLRRHALPGSNGLHWFGDLVLDSHGEELSEVSIEPPHERDDENWRPTVLMERVAAFLQQHGQVRSKRLIRQGVTGKEEAVISALNYLILDGYVSEQPPYRLLRPYPS